MTSKRPHLLYVAWGFPPCRGGGVYRGLATANEAVRAGFDVTVLTAQSDIFERYTGADESLLDLVDPSVSVERIPFSWPTRETDLREHSALRVFAPRVWNKLRTKLDMLSFPEVGYGPWRRPLERATARIHKRKPVDLVIGTANPNVDLVPGAFLHKRHGVPFVVDYRDAWLLHVFDGTQTFPDTSRAARWERNLFEAAQELWFVNDPIRAWHANRYPQAAARMHTVTNGYDPGLAPTARRHGRGLGDPLRFGFIGTVSGRVPMGPFVDGWRLAREQDPEFAANRAEVWGYLGFYSTPSPTLTKLFAESSADGVTYNGPVAKREVADVYERFDALLLILGTGRYVTSGKVFEYTASALPIVSVHEPTNAASDVLRGYPLWFPAHDLSAPSIATALRQAAAAARTADDATRIKCAEFAARYSREAQLQPRLSELRSTLPGGQNR